MSDDYREIDFKIHYDYYGEKRCTMIGVSLRELLSLGYVGLEGLIQSQIRYLGRMPVLRIMYKDDENDFIDMMETNFKKFIRQVRSIQICDRAVVNLKVTEGSSPAGNKVGLSDDRSKSKCVNVEQDPGPQARKGLDFPTLSPDSEQSMFDFFEYKFPLDHSLQYIEEEMNQLEVQVQSAKERVTELTDRYCAVVQGRGKQCSNCHLRLDHNIRQCRIDKCVTSEQCGDLNKHPDQKLIVDSAADTLKKLERELSHKRDEYEMRLKAKNSASQSFSQRVRTHLINSNKNKYLIRTAEGVVPRSAAVNVDLAKLEKHFKGKVPAELEVVSTLFENIIAGYDRANAPQSPMASTSTNPARRLLEDNSLMAVKFPRLSGKTLNL